MTENILYVQDIVDNLEDDESGEIKDLLEELADSGSRDFKHEGTWYPDVLVRADYFTDFIRELAEDTIGVREEWPFTCIDWVRAADEASYDYSQVEFNGYTYYYR